MIAIEPGNRMRQKRNHVNITCKFTVRFMLQLILHSDFSKLLIVPEFTSRFLDSWVKLHKVNAHICDVLSHLLVGKISSSRVTYDWKQKIVLLNQLAFPSYTSNNLYSLESTSCTAKTRIPLRYKIHQLAFYSIKSITNYLTIYTKKKWYLHFKHYQPFNAIKYLKILRCFTVLYADEINTPTLKIFERH